MRRILLLDPKRKMRRRNLSGLSLKKSQFVTDLWISGKFLPIQVERFLLFAMQQSLSNSSLTLFLFKISFLKTFFTLPRKNALNTCKLSSFQRRLNSSPF
jgi:hypothetical protein